MASVTIGSHILQQHKILSISFLQNKSPVLHEDQVQQPLILQELRCYSFKYGAAHSLCTTQPLLSLTNNLQPEKTQREQGTKIAQRTRCLMRFIAKLPLPGSILGDDAAQQAGIAFCIWYIPSTGWIMGSQHHRLLDIQLTHTISRGAGSLGVLL